MMRSIVVTLLFFWSCSIHCVANAQSWNDSKSNTIRLQFSQLIGHPVQSLAVSIAIDGNQVLSEGFGMARPGSPATPDTIFHIGSVTKQFTAAGILALIDDNAVVRLDGSAFGLNSTLPLFFTNMDQLGGVSVGDLLSMRSGIPNFTTQPPPYTSPLLNMNSPANWREMLASFKSYQSSGVGAFGYSNTNYFLLAQIIEVVAGGPTGPFSDYHTFMRQRIFARAGMSKTGFIYEYIDPQAVALPGSVGNTFGTPDWPKGSGDIASSVNDMHKWNVALLSGQIISANSLNEMFKPASPMSGGSSYCMGWILLPNTDLVQHYHDGEIPGYHAFNAIIRNKVSGRTIDFTILASSPADPGLMSLATEVVNLAMAP